MKTEISELRKVQYYYTDLLFLLAEGHKPNIFLLNIYLFSNVYYQPNIWNYFLNYCYI